MIVTDCSALLFFVLQPDRAAGFVQAAMREDSLAAPELIDTEFLSALRRMEREGKIPTHRCQQAIDDYRQLLLVRYPSAGLIDDIWALRHNFTTYDAAYVALAKVLKARLITCDAKLARAATGMIETILV